ncbi:ChrR family anti-sigma-E factor [Asticcacaulis sp. SL142]|uniref:ChrR family anti-sigma-E factor n=1 Tax=Asticcacaulis sp. SL142 TaxID=2995155 RepID=UPI00226D0D68|nr:ChrR family anti-sigma-E factor [Asticcacaulis sp. SL142]WAC49503.1 ChrR family anti-sigma-E factor [Asticcacaulis sp. SL142]
MSSVMHHPTTELLLDYHSGRMPRGQALTVRAHAETCAECRAQLRLFDVIGAALLEDTDGVEMSADALDLALARIERPEESVAQAIAKPAKPKPYLEGIALPTGLTAQDFKPRYWAAPGVWIASLDNETDGAHTYLMGVKGGMNMPDHDHKGLELTVVLTGRFSDVGGDYLPGDLVAQAPGDIHAPAIAGGQECICLISALAPIAPKTLLGKLLKPFARI